MLQLKNIRKIYQSSGGVKTEALKGIDLTVHSGDFIAIMGASGSGKSSLMNILSLLDNQYKGTYEIDGENIKNYSDNKISDMRNQKIGFVFQQFNLLKRTSVLENVLLPTLYKTRSDDTVRALEALEKVGLTNLVNNNTNQLSGGQMQRVAIARSLIMNPSIVLADEPTGNLDHKTAHEIMNIFKSINKQGTTIVLITHEDDIASYADKKFELYDGLFQKGK